MAAIQYTIEKISVSLIKRNPENARKSRDEARLMQLADDLKDGGQIYPLICYRDKTDLHLVDGHLRLDAATIAEIKEMTVLICDRKPTPTEVLLIQARIDGHRQDFNPIDLSELLAKIQVATGGKVTDLAQAIKKSQSFCSKILKLQLLAPTVRDLVRSGALDIERAYLIASTETDADKQLGLAKKAGDLSREQLRQQLKSPSAATVTKGTSARFSMPGNVTVTVQAKDLTLANCIEVLIETVKQLKKGQSSGHDILTLPRVMRNQLRQQPQSAQSAEPIA